MNPDGRHNGAMRKQPCIARWSWRKRWRALGVSDEGSLILGGCRTLQKYLRSNDDSRKQVSLHKKLGTLVFNEMKAREQGNRIKEPEWHAT
eukprot:1142302-Pelagomonas_calceolata.AAC.6